MQRSLLQHSLLLIGTVFLCAAASAQSQLPATVEQELAAYPNLLQQIDAMAQPLIDDGLAVGLVVGVVHGDEILIRGFGETTLGNGKKPDKNTIFEIGSVSKVFTSILLADAVNRGLVGLDDPLQEIVGERFQIQQFKDQPILLWHLATHTSGLPRMPGNFMPKDPRNPYADYSFEQLYAFLKAHKLRRAPGEKYEYSNLAVAVLGHSLALIQDSTYPALLHRRITEPFGMTNTAVELSPIMRSRLAQGYDVDQNPQSNWDLPTFAGAGAIRSDMADMLRFAAANLHPESTSMEKALQLTQEIRFEGKPGPKVGLAWHVGGGGATWMHNGQTGGYHSYLEIWPEGDAAVVLLSTTSSNQIDHLGMNITRLLMNKEQLPFQYRKPAPLEAEDLQAFVGEYKKSFSGRVLVTVENGKLFAQLSFQPKARVYPAGDDTFFYRIVQAEIQFKRDADAKIISLEIHQNGAVTTWDRS